ncbi:uncharacterized protein LOC120198117 [Hibiscus syriacus]|uniref:uncharacterized protein LOC120198117 n=1 Tax=Hibiscus syriacus TaxID=106335 RepID=UPI001923383F|nr:uncharacterized protein LOC120198117 [Hibiscus syriacus]
MRWSQLRQDRHNRWIRNYLRFLVKESLEKKFKKLILFLPLNLIKLGIILPLVTAGVVLFCSRGQTQRIKVYQEGIWREWIIQLVSTLSFVTRQNSRAMSLSLTISRAWK